MSGAPLRPAWGILGGTFDPIHLGHLVIATEARETLGLDGVVVVPAAVPPHKQDRRVTAAGHRVAMVELAIAGDPALSVSRIELDRPGPSWAVDTVAVFAERAAAEGRADPVFILSAEALAGFPTWREPDRILGHCRIAVVPRPGARPVDRAALEARFPGRGDRFIELGGPSIGISATMVRERVAAGRSIRYLVPLAVDAYIREHGLYRDAA